MKKVKSKKHTIVEKGQNLAKSRRVYRLATWKSKCKQKLKSKSTVDCAIIRGYWIKNHDRCDILYLTCIRLP